MSDNENIFLVFLGLLFLIGLTILLIFGGIFLFTPNSISYCYVEVPDLGKPGYELRGNVERGIDVKIGLFNNTDEALDTARKLNCPLLSAPKESQ